MNCKNCDALLNEHYMICKNCGKPRTTLETWELKLWKAAQAEIERLTEALHGKDCAIAELSSDCERKDKLLEMLYDALCDEIKARFEAKGE